jgi:hypothetical protein
VELFERIRREHAYGVGTIQGVAKKLGVHRRMVREALADAVPRERKIAIRAKPRLEAVRSFNRGDSGSRPNGATEATAHRASDLVPHSCGDAGSQRRRVIDSSIRSGAEDSTAIGRPGDVHSAVLRLGWRSAGGLV